MRPNQGLDGSAATRGRAIFPYATAPRTAPRVPASPGKGLPPPQRVQGMLAASRMELARRRIGAPKQKRLLKSAGV